MKNYWHKHLPMKFVAITFEPGNVIDINIMTNTNGQAASAGCPSCKGEPEFIIVQVIEDDRNIDVTQSLCYCEQCAMTWKELCLPQRGIVVIFDRQYEKDCPKGTLS